MSSSSGRRYRLFPQAIVDLIQIYNHLYERSPLAAERFTSDSERKIIQLAGSRNPGVSRDWLNQDYAHFPTGVDASISVSSKTLLLFSASRMVDKTSRPDIFPESED